ncbi:hypothetical protein [Endozoicomonas atrinae]|uniref:hypothetical protein n=1 Tax=Endozoicomonas atrinae TaxID=1333660 RepID=UPI003AFF947A
MAHKAEYEEFLIGDRKSIVFEEKLDGFNCNYWDAESKYKEMGLSEKEIQDCQSLVLVTLNYFPNLHDDEDKTCFKLSFTTPIDIFLKPVVKGLIRYSGILFCHLFNTSSKA